MHASATLAESFPDAKTASRPPTFRVRELLEPAHHALEAASALSIGSLALVWIALVGLVDYWTGPEYSMLIFYLIPVTLGTWFVSRRFGILLAVLSIVTSSVADLAARLPHLRYWNETIGLISYIIFVALLSRWRGFLKQLDARVRERTAALQDEIIECARLEKEMNSVTERERRRLGHDLHDSLCQHLTGTALKAQTLRQKLAAEANGSVNQAERVVALLEEAIDLTRTMARGLLSPDVQSGGLTTALGELAVSTTERFGVECEFQHDEELGSGIDSEVATQLYRIAQEAVTNACKHAHASRVIIELDDEAEHLSLNVYDDGVGIEESGDSPGLGLRMMRHGAQLIGAHLNLRRNEPRGTLVSCTLNQLSSAA